MAKIKRNYTPGKPSVTEIIGKNLGWKTNGLIQWAHRLGREGRSMGERDEAAARGSCAHDIVECLIAGNGRTTDSLLGAWSEAQIEDARPNAQRVLDEIVKREWTVIACELAMETSSFAGTVDLVVRDATGQVLVVDLKTGKGAYDETVIQLGAYAWLWRSRCFGALEDALMATSGAVIHAPYGAPLKVFPVSTQALIAGEQAFRLLLSLHEIAPQIKMGDAL